MRHFLFGYDYRARKHETAEDLSCVPRDSIQTDHADEFWAWIKQALGEDFVVEFEVRKRVAREVYDTYWGMNRENLYAYPR